MLWLGEVRDGASCPLRQREAIGRDRIHLDTAEPINHSIVAKGGRF